jgi:hypothetical protein
MVTLQRLRFAAARKSLVQPHDANIFDLWKFQSVQSRRSLQHGQVEATVIGQDGSTFQQIKDVTVGGLPGDRPFLFQQVYREPVNRQSMGD